MVGLMFKTQKIQKQELHLLYKQQEEQLLVQEIVEFIHLQGQELFQFLLYLPRQLIMQWLI